MVEPIMYLAIGFLVSMLFGLMIVPLVHNRAVRLTTRRMEAATPLSMAEIQADKDQLRLALDPLIGVEVHLVLTLDGLPAPARRPRAAAPPRAPRDWAAAPRRSAPAGRPGRTPP